jgi:hypothetical protein
LLFGGEWCGCHSPLEAVWQREEKRDSHWAIDQRNRLPM